MYDKTLKQLDDKTPTITCLAARAICTAETESLMKFFQKIWKGFFLRGKAKCERVKNLNN